MGNDGFARVEWVVLQEVEGLVGIGVFDAVVEFEKGDGVIFGENFCDGLRLEDGYDDQVAIYC